MLANTLKLLEKLVSFDTTSVYSNLDLIEWVSGLLGNQGIKSELIYNTDKTKANIFASISNFNGASHEAGIILSGHTDVVPVAGQNWQSDPFKLTEQDGKLLGRGTTDMKGFIACCLAMVPIWQSHAKNNRLKHPIHLAFSYDEEIGCLGVRPLIDYIQAKNLNLAGCIVGEPTNMVPVIAHKGLLAYRCCVRGKAAHSALPQGGVNAIYYASKLINYLYELADNEIKNSIQNQGFDVPYSTLNVGVIKGGTALNIIAQDCEFNFDYRYLPSVNPEILISKIKSYAQNLTDAMQKESKESAINFELLADVAGLNNTKKTEFLSYLKALTHNNHCLKVSYATEAGLFSKANIPAIICGPGNINIAHQANEYIEITELEKCLLFLSQI